MADRLKEPKEIEVSMPPIRPASAKKEE